MNTGSAPKALLPSGNNGAGYVPPGADAHSLEGRNTFVNDFEPHFVVPKRLQRMQSPFVDAVNGFHFAMMNDVPRNEFYYKLLQKHVTPDSGVLEIGAGSGLLSMIAARLGAKWVVAVEGSADMAELARRNVAINGFQDRVTVLCMMSTDLKLEDLPSRPDILVSEILGTFLLEESAHDYIEDIRKRILKPTSRILPQHGVQYAVPIECPTLDTIRSVQSWNGFDLSQLNAAKDTASTLWTTKYGFRMSSVPFRKLSAPLPVVTVDFATCNRRDVKRSRSFPAVPTESGTVHAMLLFWEVTDEGLEMSTDPDKTRDNFPRDMQWGQAIQLVDGANEPMPVAFMATKGEPISVRCRSSTDNMFLQFSLSHGKPSPSDEEGSDFDEVPEVASAAAATQDASASA